MTRDKPNDPRYPGQNPYEPYYGNPDPDPPPPSPPPATPKPGTPKPQNTDKPNDGSSPTLSNGQGTNYLTWTWGQVQKALYGSGWTDMAQSGPNNVADQRTLFEAGMRFYNMAAALSQYLATMDKELFGLVGMSISNNNVGDHPAWSGTGSAEFGALMKNYIQVSRTYFDALTKPSYQDTLVNQGNKLVQSLVDVWYLLTQVPPTLVGKGVVVDKDGKTYVQLGSEADRYLNTEAGKILDKLAYVDGYQKAMLDMTAFPDTVNPVAPMGPDPGTNTNGNPNDPPPPTVPYLPKDPAPDTPGTDTNGAPLPGDSNIPGGDSKVKLPDGTGAGNGSGIGNGFIPIGGNTPSGSNVESGTPMFNADGSPRVTPLGAQMFSTIDPSSGMPLKNPDGTPMVDANGNQLYAASGTPLFNKDGTPKLDANGLQMFSVGANEVGGTPLAQLPYTTPLFPDSASPLPIGGLNGLSYPLGSLSGSSSTIGRSLAGSVPQSLSALPATSTGAAQRLSTVSSESAAGTGQGFYPPMMGGMGGGAGGGGGGERGQERVTWLVEDEDMWGAEPEAAPAVLGRV